MLRRLTTLGLGLVLLAGCGTEGVRETPADPGATSPAAAEITTADAQAAFDGLGDLSGAWKDGDCATIEQLTTGVERTIDSRVCAAARDGLAAPAFRVYRDPEFLLPAREDGEDGEDGAWFAVLARKPEPAYFVLVRVDGRWRLGAGPIPLVGKAPEVEGGMDGEVTDAAADPAAAVGARLAPTRHVAFLTDPAGVSGDGVSGVRFASGDPMRRLLTELVRAPGRVRPDHLSTDVRIEGPARALALPGGGSLVFHALRVVFSQKPGSGRHSLAHPRYRAADVRAFTGGAPTTVTGSEIVVLATRVAKDNTMTTVGLRRVLAEITEGSG
ncbi:hypothetical protein [Microbispora siamensis]|uniref:Lipoprotein n=1 Tax=Microbispora siamensis TaxID=564413 RepID=A0ABQ4GPF5_9ACTN|nr:hypothetical protein [Microbispora siamensis]GIH63307.1 hypothetical protein Msi02_41240 [Microbispora siamensis]